MIATALVLVPIVAAALCVVPRRGLARAIAVTAGIIAAALAAYAASWSPMGMDPESAVVWVGAGVPIAYHVGLEGFGATLAALGGILFAVGAAASARVAHARFYFALWCLLQAAVSGVFVARDLVLFFLFWEAMLVPLALLMWQWGGADRRGATLRFLLYTMAGSAIFLAAVVSIGVSLRTFDLEAIAAARKSEGTQTVLALMFLAAFCVKLPLFPLHGWLPRAYAAAPVPVAAVLSGIVAKTAVYGIVQLCAVLFPLGMARLLPYGVALAAAGTLYGALLATRQSDVRRLIAFSSLSHLNLIGLGAFALVPLARQGALLASVSHGLVVVALFLLAVALASRAGGFDLARAGGLARSAPILTAFFTLAVVAAIGVPGTSGFAGEFLVLAGAYAAAPWAVAAATAVAIVSAVYGLGMLRRAFFGPPLVAVADLGLRERAPLVLLLALVVAIGVAPTVITDRISEMAGHHALLGPP